MNSQEFERKMNDIAGQHARIAADAETRRKREAEFDERHRVWKIEIEDILTRLSRVVNVGFKELDAKINVLIDAQIRMEDEQRRTDEQLRKTDEQIRQTAEQQQITDEQVRQTTEQLRRTDEWLRRHLGGKRNGGNND